MKRDVKIVAWISQRTMSKAKTMNASNLTRKGSHWLALYSYHIYIYIHIYIGTLNMLSCFCCSLLITIRIHSIAFFFPLDTKDPQRCRGLRATRNFRGIQCGLHGENWREFNGETLGKSLAIVVVVYWQN